MNKRQEDWVARKRAGKQKKPNGGGATEHENEKGQSITSQKVVKEGEESPRYEEENNGDLESQPSTTPGKTLYVTSDSKRRVFPDFLRRMNQLFNDDRSRRALVCASTAMISQQLCGINTISKHYFPSYY